MENVPKYKQLYISLETELRDWLEAYARNNHITMTQLIKELVLALKVKRNGKTSFDETRYLGK